MIRRLAAALACLALSAGCARAEPAMWVVKDADSTIYLLGTVHLLRPELSWKTPRISEALASCADLTLELPDGGGAGAVQPLIARLGFDAEHPLSAKLKPDEQAELARAAAAMGAPAERFDTMRPWLAALTLSVAPLLRAGYDPAAGVEQLLMADARAAGKPISGLETMEEQVSLLANLPEEAQLDFLRQSLEDFEEAPTELDSLAKAWSEGRVGEIDRLVNEELRHDSPALYRSLLLDRNRAFAADIKAMLAGAGTRCVAIGAGHLAGDDSVQAQLKALGVASARY